VLFGDFTDRARRVVALAQDEGRRLGHTTIRPGHLLLGLVIEGEGVAARALQSVGVTFPAAWSVVATDADPVAAPVDRAERLGPDTRGVLERAPIEARKLGHRRVGTEHLLLALVHVEQRSGVGPLGGLGIDLAGLRAEVIALSGDGLSGGARPSAAIVVDEERSGPRCPTCRSDLDGRVGYRILAVPPVDGPETAEPIQVIFVHCLNCRVVIAHAPADGRTDRSLPPPPT
jgi:hypothetical protein